MTLDLEKLPALYGWIWKNAVKCLVTTIFLLAVVGAYDFLNGWAPRYGQSVAEEHADFRRAVQSYTHVDDALTHLMHEVHANRITLFRFHDSQKDLSRMSFFFASVANIVAMPGVTVDAADITNVPAANFAPVLPTLLAHKSIMVRAADLLDGMMRELQTRRGATYAAFIPVTDLDDSLIGFLEIDWMNEADAPKSADFDKLLPVLTDDASKISGYLSLPHMQDSKHRRSDD